MENRIEIPLSKSKILILVLASVAFVVAGVFIAIYPEQFTSSSMQWINNPEVIRIIGLIGILYFTATGIYGVKKLQDKKIGLIIDDQGITDNSNAASIGYIEWQDITGIRVQQVMSTKFLLIDVSEPEKYMAKAKSKLQKRLMSANMKTSNTPLSITANTLKYDFDALETLVKGEFQKHKKDV